MKKLHTLTLSLFLVAMLLYTFSPVLGFGLAILGAFIEILAWFSLFDDYKDKK